MSGGIDGEAVIIHLLNPAGKTENVCAFHDPLNEGGFGKITAKGEKDCDVGTRAHRLIAGEDYGVACGYKHPNVFIA